MQATWLVAALWIVGCGKSDSKAGGSGADLAATKPSAAAGSVCDRKLLTIQDVSGILAEPVTGAKPLEGDPQTCQFVTASVDRGGPTIRITLRPGHGTQAVKAALDGTMNVDAKPVAGIGDSAAWIEALSELDVDKGGTLCVAAVGGAAAIQAKPSDLQARLGALCTKVFAAL